MEFGSSQRDFSLEKAPRTRQSNRPLLRKQKKKIYNMSESSSDDDEDVKMMDKSEVKKKRLNENDMFQQLLESDQKEVLEEQRQDNVLKELGLYEEGMSKEQKQELLLVVEASKESAEKEATKRRKSDVWSSDVVVMNRKTKDSKESLPSSSSRSTSPSQEGKKGKLVPHGDSDEDTRMTPSQDLFPLLHNDPEQQLLSQEKMQDQEEDSYGSFPPGQQRSESPVVKPSDSSAKPGRWFLNRLNRKRCSQQDRRTGTNAMETAMTVWTSQIASSVVTSLVRKTKRNVPLSDEVPYFCPLTWKPSAYTKAILRNMNDYHVCLQRAQRRTSVHIPWGDPISLGKSRVVGQHRSKDAPSTSVEDPMDDQAQALPDLEVWPVGHLEIRPVTEEKPVQITESSKKDDVAEDVFDILSRGSGSVEKDDSSKKPSNPESEIDDVSDDGKHYVIEKSFRRPRLSLLTESEFEIVPLTLDDDTSEGDIAGGAMSSADRIVSEIKPKQLRKRNRNNNVAANNISTEKRPKRQVKDKYSSIVKSLYIPLQRVELSEEYKLYTGKSNHNSEPS